MEMAKSWDCKLDCHCRVFARMVKCLSLPNYPPFCHIERKRIKQMQKIYKYCNIVLYSIISATNLNLSRSFTGGLEGRVARFGLSDDFGYSISMILILFGHTHFDSKQFPAILGQSSIGSKFNGSRIHLCGNQFLPCQAIFVTLLNRRYSGAQLVFASFRKNS